MRNSPASTNWKTTAIWIFWLEKFWENWTPKSFGHLDDTTRAVWRHVRFVVRCLFYVQAYDHQGPPSYWHWHFRMVNVDCIVSPELPKTEVVSGQYGREMLFWVNYTFNALHFLKKKIVHSEHLSLVSTYKTHPPGRIDDFIKLLTNSMEEVSYTLWIMTQRNF